MGSPAPPPTSGRSAVDSGSSGPDHKRPHGGSRRASGGTSNAIASRFKTNGILRPKTRTLPLPSRRRVANSGGRDGDSGGADGAGGRGGDSDRWANPAPRGRHGHGGLGSSATYGYPGSIENRGGGGGGSVSSRTSKISADTHAHLSHNCDPPRSYDSGSGQQRSSQWAGGAPVYRSGSPAPVRSRRPSTNAAASAAAAAADSSRFLYQQRTRALDNKKQSFGIPPGFRGYMVSSVGDRSSGDGRSSGGDRGSGGGRSSGGIADNSVRGTTARQSYIPSPTTRDRGRRASSGSDGVGRYDPVKKPGPTDRSPGQRPSTSEGLTGGSGAGRRGRSASPAPRPSSGKALHCVPWAAC